MKVRFLCGTCLAFAGRVALVAATFTIGRVALVATAFAADVQPISVRVRQTLRDGMRRMLDIPKGATRILTEK